MKHCWENGPETKDMSTTCVLLDGHEGPHEWTRDDEIVLTEIAKRDAEIERLRVIAADYQKLQRRANAIDDENERLRAACNLVIEALNVLGEDGWSDAPHLMRELSAALEPTY